MEFVIVWAWACSFTRSLARLCARFLSASSHIRHITLAHVGSKSILHLKIHCEKEKKKKKKKKRYISFNCYFKLRQNLRSCFLLLEMIFFLDTKRTGKMCVFVYANKSANKLKRAHTHTHAKQKKWNEMIQQDLLFIQLFNSSLSLSPSIVW